jgi:hypothetical protein
MADFSEGRVPPSRGGSDLDGWSVSSSAEHASSAFGFVLAEITLGEASPNSAGGSPVSHGRCLGTKALRHPPPIAITGDRAALLDEDVRQGRRDGIGILELDAFRDWRATFKREPLCFLILDFDVFGHLRHSFGEVDSCR